MQNNIAQQSTSNPKLTVTIPGAPVAQGRPRLTKSPNGHPIVYDPGKSREYKGLVRMLAYRSRGQEPLKNPVRLSFFVYFPIPKSFSKKRKEDALSGRIRPAKKPDLSNVIKGIEDALNGVWYEDDSQIVEYGVVGKWYSDDPRVVVECEVVENAEPPCVGKTSNKAAYELPF